MYRHPSDTVRFLEATLRRWFPYLRATVGGAEEQVDYEFDINSAGNVGGSTLTTWLGQRVRVDSGTDSTDYSYDEQFKWVDRCTGWICSDNHHTEHNYGTAYWNA